MLLTIEGIDGSGKGTQSRLLVERMRDVGLEVEFVTFPRYSETFFGKEIGLYLNGEFGELMNVHAKLGALLYAGDRFESKGLLAGWLKSGKTVVCDRYTYSNKAHHAAKLPTDHWDDFFDWVDTLEHEVFGVQRPDLVIFLDVDAELSATLIRGKPKREYTDHVTDLHESSSTYQAMVHQAYRALAHRDQWVGIQCTKNGQLKSEDEISNIIWDLVQPHLRLETARSSI